MATPNINAILQGILVITDQNVGNAPQLATLDFGNPTLPSGSVGGTDFFYSNYFQAFAFGGSPVPFPAVPSFLLAVQNRSPSGVISVSYTPHGGSAHTITLGPGGVFLYFDPLETGQGIDGATLAGVSGGPFPAAVLVVV